MSSTNHNNIWNAEKALQWQANKLEYAKTPLRTLDDCFRALDVSPRIAMHTDFSKIREAYRRQLYYYSLDDLEPEDELYELHSLMLKKIGQAYGMVCKAFKKSSEDEPDETEESLIAERNRMLCDRNHTLYTNPAIHIMDEYADRIDALRRRTDAY